MSVTDSLEFELYHCACYHTVIDYKVWDLASEKVKIEMDGKCLHLEIFLNWIAIEYFSSSVNMLSKLSLRIKWFILNSSSQMLIHSTYDVKTSDNWRTSFVLDLPQQMLVKNYDALQIS